MYSLWCEWDIGHEGCIFKTKERAKSWAEEHLKYCDIEETFDELYEEGLIGYDDVWVIE